jgi:citrate synthase
LSTSSTNPAAAATITLVIDGESLTLPMVEGSEGERAIVVESLRAKSGLITLDPGYGNTGSCRSSVTFIDGEKGILRYRGYPIEELAEKSTFLEVAWLLIHGDLPTRVELEQFTADVTRHTLLHENFKRFFEAFPRTRTRCRCARRPSRRCPRSTRTPNRTRPCATRSCA